MHAPKMRIVVVSPSAAERNALCDLLVGDGHQVATAAMRAEGLDLVSLERPDVLIADAQLAGFDGRAWIRALVERGLMPRVILLCPRASRMFEGDGVICLTKPIELDVLRRCIAEASPPRSNVA